ncbi:Cullin-domain-containing protein [Lentinus tigrinus ALCF2SS1-6]|uniref:Cullin-domain-containing protein n=1 Tax=Lentinus tigrinus ALCF2SS1-6 TaxID=1328759 RepID=A0A5C2SAY8_9APHY|nr:Cullin-domain-containing protein [Lentinus tigrinus ALCF2SS1-6]
MADVFTLLTLPQTSDAFSKLSAQPHGAASANSTRDTSRSASPPRKIARLDHASDTHSASASSSRAAISELADKRGPVVLRVIGYPIKPTPASAIDADYALVRRSVKVLLTPDDMDGRPALPATYDRISRACRAVVADAGRGEGLYDIVKMELERCVGGIEKKLVNAPEKSVQWLKPFTKSCAWFEGQVSLLQSLLAYLDTLYVAEKINLSRIKPLAYTMFTRTVIKSARVTQAIMDGLADWLEDERTKRHENEMRPYLPQLVRHMRAHNLYADLIELTYLNLTQTFYTKESNELVARGDVPADEFLNQMDKRIKEEEERARAVLVESSIDAVKDTTRSALLTGRLQWLATDAIKALFEKEDHHGLKRMYENFAKVGGLKVLHAAFKAYVQFKVKAIVTDTEHDEEMVERLLKFKAFADGLVANAFVDRESAATPSVPAQPVPSSSSASVSAPPTAPAVPNRDFSYGLIDAFQAGFKARRNKPAEMIAKYMDKAMRRGQKGKRDEDFEAELDRVLALYRFTDDMDVFRTFYQRALAKRLLLGRSASDDFEKAILKKLKEKYDPEFGMSDHMFTDLTLSRELMTGFLEGEERRGDTSRLQKMNVMVLQRSAWPFAARKADIDLPRWMQDDLATYLVYYHQKFQGRKLDWDHSLGTATLKARFKAGEKELSVSLYQAVILLLFNDSDSLSYAEIKEQTRLDDAELQRTLQSLACGKKRVVRKNPLGKDVHKTDTFHFNADFTDPRYQVHVNSIQAKETPEETKRTQNSIEQDRKHALDAAIVRVMKGKKELTYEQLKTATIEAVKRHFVPDVAMIKKRIEGLVEQEYLRRDEEDLNKYFYVA